MESDIFSEILSVLCLKFVPNGDKVFDYLLYLAKLKRFRALVLFLSQKDKEGTFILIIKALTKE